MTSDLDDFKLLVIRYHMLGDPETEEKLESLKSKIEEQLELGEYAGHMKKYADEFKQQVKQLQEENKEVKASCDLWFRDHQNLKAKLDKIKEYCNLVEFWGCFTSRTITKRIKAILEKK